MKKMLEYQVKSDCIDEARIARLQHKMEKRKASICSERALLYTESFQKSETEPYIIRKAKAFAHTLDLMSIYIEEDSLIFGNQASRNFAAPIFPEYSIDWVIDELDAFALRKGDVFTIDEQTKKDLRSIHDYWHSHTHEDEVKKNLPEENFLAEKQGVLHRGGISMSGDGHIVPKHEKVLEVGFLGLIEEAQTKLEVCKDKEKIAFYNAVIITLNASLRWIKRYGLLAVDMAKTCNDEKRKAELYKIADMCEHLLERKANGFYEAVESVYLIHVLQMIESNGHSFCYGRFDQYIYPFYEADVASGKLNDDKALELITHMFLMNSSLNKVRPYGHTKFSQGYPLYSNLMIGGYRRDGKDGTNALSYLAIEAMNLTSLAEPNFSMRYNNDTPDDLLRLAAKLIRTGCGMPSMFNDEVIVKAKEGLGIPHEDALDYVAIGCVETGIPGKYGHRATGMTYVNWGKVLEILLNNGYDPDSKLRLITLGNEKETMESCFETYDDVWTGWKKLLKYYTDLAVACDHVCDQSLAKYDADPFASSLIDDCLEKGKILKLGGAKYDIVSQSNIGPSVVGNSLAVLKKLVFEEKKITLQALKDAMKDNWESLESKRIHQMVTQVAKFGNDEDYVDDIVIDVFNSYLELLPDYKTNCSDMGPDISGYTMSTSNITSYVPNGLDVGATPDGRFARSPLNEGCSPTEGTDIKGPTAVINSVAKLPNERIAAGQLLNMRFTPESLEGANLEKFIAFLKVSRKKEIYHNQFNIIDSTTLRKAQQNPEKYTDLIVRVAGYCAQFVSLMSETQDAIINRSENSI
ncbi:pyruvate formate-lyase/glycerol dehydratase family glycyl radical enzyme [Breznakia sp. PF5-3]|uniref:glycyl radical protein n=1 Tax=unclassified Breznakia TaxID=2623764 RepID=UPI00240657DD|nr:MULTISPECIES: formate C-acetyltransferase/glycerol dehydratase family glycyl radical enzyme [unclassified Breznakia]MDF9823827.1 pyruvate formate-lyase/glycerol dehydratase family glycyl radical enzyme [Breznakia sp. PM6-1]MDF9834607.1 pyruvate formate-lyase/glycerol dehydratase family glycyl radical enzyme [Breznakia sp. PF5-3]MDF9836776.1 pyruvate formate-lyase/glycerol dehydratase family glycyl radical enzyme [Breznakia sp. PFB2-8]MDF9858775.1 pyruvate formate-lyase/glycerol dehydratase f